MIAGTLILEDCSVNFSHNVSDTFEVTITDQLTGKSETDFITTEQLGAMIALALGLGEDPGTPAPVVSHLYAVCDTLSEEFKTNPLRIYP